MVNQSLQVSIGNLTFKNPLICGSGEHLMESKSIEDALSAGAAAVVAKSTNESDDAKKQLNRADYAKIGHDFTKYQWEEKTVDQPSLFCRSGLIEMDAKEWLDVVATIDGLAKKNNAYVVASLIPGKKESLVELADTAQQLGIRILELNVSAPHGKEMNSHIHLEQQSSGVFELVKAVREVYHGDLWVKITGMTNDVPDLCQAAKNAGADATVMTGRFLAMIPDLDTMNPVLGTNGAYGGRWALPITCRNIAESRHLVGKDYQLIGTNGARDGLDIARMMLAGASAVEMTSSIFTEGSGVIKSSLDQLQSYLNKKNISASEIIGIVADKVQSYDEQLDQPGYWKQFINIDK